MEKQLLTTDETIISEYFKLYDVFGETDECCKKIKRLIKSTIIEKQKLWTDIFNGIMFGFTCNGKYLESYQELSKINIENKKSPLYIFVEREKMYAFALLDEKNVDTTISDYNNLVNHFSQSTVSAILLQVAQTMLTESFLMGLLGNIEEELRIENQLIEKFGDSNDFSIQIIVAKCINNKTTTLEQISKVKKEVEIIQLRDKIIDTHKNTSDIRMQLQVAKSMLSNAIDLQELMDIEKIRFESTDREREEQIQRTIYAYEDIIGTFGHSKIVKIQEKVAHAMCMLIDILTKIDLEKSVEICDVLKNKIGKIKNNQVIVLYYLLASKSITDVLIQKEYFDEALIRLADIIEVFEKENNTMIREYVKEIVVECLIQKIGILSNQQIKIEECLETMAILNQISPMPFLEPAEAQMIYTKALKTEENNCDEAIKLYDKIIDKFSCSNFEIAQLIVGNAKYRKMAIPSILAEKKRIEENKEKTKELFDFYLDNERSINDLIESITKGHTIPLIGAGLSKFAEYPLWFEFLDEIYNKPNYDIKEKILKDDFESMSCTKKASTILNFLEQARFIREIKHYFSDSKTSKLNDECLQKQPLYLLPDLFKEQLILTTNFDNLIQRVYEIKGLHIISTSTENIEMLDSLSSDKTILYKIHGTIDVPRSVVLTEGDYEKHYDKKSPNYKTLNSRMKGKNILFLGCGLNEDDEILTFCVNGDNYAIYPCESKEKTHEIARKLGRKNIIPVLYPPQNEHIYLRIILEYIVDSISQKKRNNFIDTITEQAKKLQGKVSNAQDELGEKIIVGTSKNNCVTVKMSGKYDILDFEINESYINCPKKELEASILFALRSAKEQTDEIIDDIMGEATKDMPNLE